MKLALVSLNESTDVHEWSGLNFHIADALERAGADVVRVGPLRAHWSPVMKVRQRWYDATGRVYHAIYDPASLRALGEQARAALPRDADAIVAVTSLMAAALGPLERPLVSWDDANPWALADYYPEFRAMPRVSRRQSLAMGHRALRAARLALYASDWAADHARAAEPGRASEIAVVPFGANLAATPEGVQVRRAVAGRAAERCHLLWVGVDWHRKGGALTLEIARNIAEAGVPVALTLAGCDPPPEVSLPEWVTKEGFLSKRSPQGARRLEALFQATHFFVMPSRAEAYGLVYCEAAAYGIPVVATRTGGVPTIVADGVTGVLESPQAGAEVYARRILALWQDPVRYRAMALAARARFERLLNWDVAGRSALERIARVVAG